MAAMKMSDDGMRFLIAREGKVSSMYNDNAGHCTVGVGHLVHKGPTEFGTSATRHPYGTQPDPHTGMTPTQMAHWDLERPFFSALSDQQVMNLLHSDIQRYEKAINDTIKVTLTQSQFDALVSFCFNVGIANFEHSTLAKKINQKDYVGAGLEFNKWVKSNHKINPGLVTRRRYEEALFAKGDYVKHEHSRARNLKRPSHTRHRQARLIHPKQNNQGISVVPSRLP